MPNVSGKAYALTVLAPIKSSPNGGSAYADEVKYRLNCLGVNEQSPLAKVPNTYLARLFVLNDVYYESTPGRDPFNILRDFWSIFQGAEKARKYRFTTLPKEDHLKSRYLVFSCNFHGDLDTYLRNMWAAIADQIRHICEHCVRFDRVHDAESFIAYIKKCQIETTLFFVGSNDEPLAEQLKALYLKQEFAKFAVQHQGVPAAELQKAFAAFVERTRPKELSGPSWVPGQSTGAH